MPSIAIISLNFCQVSKMALGIILYYYVAGLTAASKLYISFYKESTHKFKYRSQSVNFSFYGLYLHFILLVYNFFERKKNISLFSGGGGGGECSLTKLKGTRISVDCKKGNMERRSR